MQTIKVITPMIGSREEIIKAIAINGTGRYSIRCFSILRQQGLIVRLSASCYRLLQITSLDIQRVEEIAQKKQRAHYLQAI